MDYPKCALYFNGKLAVLSQSEYTFYINNLNNLPTYYYPFIHAKLRKMIFVFTFTPILRKGRKQREIIEKKYCYSQKENYIHT
jgi:hypothetical protein